MNGKSVVVYTNRLLPRPGGIGSDRALGKDKP